MAIEVIIVINILVWVTLQLGAAWAFTKMPGTWFERAWKVASTTWSAVCERVFQIKRWKDKLPDGATWFAGGVPKSKLGRVHTEALAIKIRETWRGELCHWAVIAFVPVFALWNPWWGVLINAAYAIAANLPCILVQQYNRGRFLHLEVRLSRNQQHGDSHAKKLSDPQSKPG